MNCQLRGYLGLAFSFVKTLPADILVCLVLILADSLQQVVKDPQLDPAPLKLKKEYRCIMQLQGLASMLEGTGEI